MRNKRKSLAILLASAMMLSAFAGCSGTDPSSNGSSAPSTTAAPGSSSTAGSSAQSGTPQTDSSNPYAAAEAAGIDTSNLNPPGTIPILKNTVKLTMGVTQDTNIEDRNTNAYTKMWEEGANVEFEFIDFPSADAKQKLSVMIASDSELPDMVTISLSDIETYTYGSQGYFIDQNLYMDTLSYYMKQYLDNGDEEKYGKYIRSADGALYSFPRIIEDLGNDWCHRHWINKTWLEKLNLTMPKTTEEYYNVLKAFKEQDPNGNGKADEMPLLGNRNGWAQDVWKTLMNAFIYSNCEFDYLLVDNGKISAAYNQEGWRKGLEYMNKLCSEGLLSPLTFTQDQNEFKQIIEDQDAQLIGSMTAGSMSVYQPASKRKEDMIHLPPLTGPDGVSWTSYRVSGIPSFMGFITKSCKDPVAAFMAFDYTANYDMAMTARFGVKDVDWKDPEPGAKGLYESMGYQPLFEYINPIWGTLQNSQWGENHPTRRTYEMICGTVWDGNPYDSQYMTAQAVPDYMDKKPEETVERIIYLPEEVEEIADIKSSLDTYRDEAVAAFITGNRPLSDWDNYVKELDNIGLARYLEVAQTAYDRMNGKA